MAYELRRLYCVSRRNIEYFDTTVSFEEFQYKAEVNSKLYVAVKNKLTTKTHALDFSHMLTDRIFKDISTWGDFLNMLTDELIIGYSCELPGFLPGTNIPVRQVIAWDLMNTTNTFTVNYADHHTGIKGLYPARWKLLDLAIELQPKATKTPKLPNCLPLINGFCRRPLYYETNNTLFALQGATLVRPYTEHVTPEIQLLDFSQLGDISTYNLTAKEISETNCQIRYCSRTEEFTNYADWFIYTPFSLADYTPILVIGGILIFPDEYRIVNSNCIAFNPLTVPFHVSESLKMFVKDEVITPAAVAYKTDTLNEFFTKQFNPTDSTTVESFVVAVHTPRLYIHRSLLDLWNNNILMNNYQEEGLLRHEASHCIKVFHKENLVDRQELTVQNAIPLYRGDRSYEEAQISCIEPDACKHLDLQNIVIGNYSMITVTS